MEQMSPGAELGFRFGSREHMLLDDSDADVHFKIEDL